MEILNNKMVIEYVSMKELLAKYELVIYGMENKTDRLEKKIDELEKENTQLKKIISSKE